MQMLWLLLIGLISDWLAGLISHGRGFGIWRNLVTGVLGSFIGDIYFNLIGMPTFGTIDR